MEQKQTKFISAVNRTINRYRMLSTGDTVLVAVSGGPDSVALLHALNAIRTNWSLRLVVAHLNHGLRQGEAQKDAEFVQKLAASLKLECDVGYKDVKRFSNTKGFSIQEGAREARYLFLRDAAARHGAGRIAMGHHADDNAESVLINLLRGTGPRGLAGIPPVREHFIRPLIEISHDRIMDYLVQKNFSYTTDQSNWNPKYLRNRVRHELIPLLKERFYMHDVSVLNRLTSIMRSEETFWEPVVEKALHESAVKMGDTQITVPVSNIAALHPALSHRLIRLIVARLTGTSKGIRLDQVESVSSLVASTRSWGAVHLTRGVRVLREHNNLIFRLGEQPVVSTFEYTIAAPEPIALQEIGVMLRLTTNTVGDMRQAVRRCPANTALFDLETVSFPMIVRNFRPGDRFVPLGMSGSQKVKDFFINTKVPRSKRMACPLLLSAGRIIWVGGYRVSDRVKITGGTKQVLKAELTDLAEK